MKRKFIAMILCLCMIFSLFVGYETAFAQEEKGEYIVYLDVEKLSPGYEKAFINKDYSKAISLADKALDSYEKELKARYSDLETISRAQLLVPSLCVSVSKNEIEAIKKLDYVKEVFNNETIYEDDVVRSNMAVFQDKSIATDSIKMVNSNELIGNDEALQAKYNGAGSVLAIIDSNMDPSHPAFYLSPLTRPRLAKLDINNFINGGKLSVRDNTADKKLYEDVYRSEKIPFGWNYNTNSKDLNPEKELAAHGQHVSGTVAGNAYDIKGKTWRGVAPEAQLLMMNVMKQGSTSSNIYIRAMQDAIVMGAEAVNMSLGSTKGLPGQVDGLVGKAINNGYAADTNFVIAAGNEGEYQGNLNIDNPDYGTIAAPGIATNAITVASLENTKMYAPVITFEGTKYIFHTGGDVKFTKGDYSFIDCGLGKKEDFAGKDLTGKVALIKRGGITFNEKVLNAEAANAIGAIIYNNVAGDLYMSVKGNKIPAISVTLDTAEKMLAKPNATVNIDMDPQEIANPDYGELSSFTNWGLSIGGYMKPDITAPGGHIYSTQTMGNTFGDMSGTSMATPHVTGGVGVIRSRLNEILFAGVKNKAALTKTILMNSAVPHVDPKTGQTTSPRRQGAGVMNLTRATKLDFTVVDKDTKIASKFVGNVDNEITLNLTIHNYSSNTKTLTPSVQATIEARDGKKLLRRPDELFSNTYEDKKVTVPGQSEVEYTITFPIEHMEKVEPFTNGAFVEGFLHLRDQDGMEVSFPFVSFKGKYDTIPSIEKPVYDFDFETEKPMYWNLKTKNHDWYKYSTHIETNYGTYKDEKGRTSANVVIAGIKNFAEIDENKNTDKEPKPVFVPIVISPNGDNYQDALGISMVMTRTANVKASIIDEAGKSNDFNIGLKYSNISTDPDNDKSREQYLGFTSPGSVPLKDFADGEYTLRLRAAAVKAQKESYPETYRDMHFMIDTVAPEIVNPHYDEATRTLTFDIKEEGSGLDEFKIEGADGKAINFTKEANKVKVLIPEGKELSDINITAMDFGHNINAVTAEMLVYKDSFGSLEVEVKQAGTEALNLEYEVQDEKGKVYKNHEHLKFGKYKLIVTNYSNKFELKGESEIPFEISKENRNHKITLEFTEIPTGRVTIKVASKDNLEWADFDLYAKNVKNNKVIKFVQDEGIYDKYFDADLPYGDYNFYAEFKNGKKGYSITFDEDMPFTVNGSTNYSTVTANIKRVGFYKVHVTTEGTTENVKYLAKDSKNGSIVGLEELAEGTWMIFPDKMPEGMYLEKPYEYVTLSQEKPEASITFTYEEIADKKFKFNIKDNYDKAVYYLCDFYKWIGREGNVLDYTPGMELTPGTYFVKAIADKERYGETTITIDGKDYVQTSRTFSSTTDPVELEFNWTKYSDTDNTVEGAIFVNDDALAEDQKKGSYEYVLTGTKGEPITKTFIKTGFSSWFPVLPYDYYKVEVKGLPEGYTTNIKELYVNSDAFNVELKVIPEEEAPSEKVSIDIKFMKGAEEVQNVTYKLGEEEFNKNNIEVAPGEYNVTIVSPEGLVPREDSKTVTISKDTKNLTINLEDKKVEPAEKVKVNFEFYFNGKKISPVKFNLDEDYETEYTDGVVELAVGEHALEVFEPAEYIQKEEFSTINVTKDTKTLRIELEEYKEPPAPSGEGTLKFEVWESDGKNETKSNMFISAWVGASRLDNDKAIKVPYGTYEVELSTYLLDKTKYDLSKTPAVQTVTVDDNNPNAVVKYVVYLKNATPGPEPTGKGKASWDINYTGSRTNLNFFEQVKLFKVTDKGDEEVKLGFEQQYKHGEIELDYGKYAYVLNDIKDYLKVSVKNKRIEFTLDKDHTTFKAEFIIEDRKEKQQVEVRIPKDANESLNDYTIRVFDMEGNEVEGVTKTAKGIEFPAVSGVDYELRLEGTKYAYYPNIINAYPSPTFPKYINIVSPLLLNVKSLAGDTTVDAKYEVYAKTNYGVTRVRDLKKVPYIGNGNQIYKVKFLSCEQGYKLKDEKVKEITVTQYEKFELTFNFERDTNVAVVNKEELRALVLEYDKIKASDAYKGAKQELKDAYDNAIAEAKLELAKAVTSQDAIDALVDKVTKARDAIIGSMENLKKKELKKLLDEADANKAKDSYKLDTEEDKKAYDDAIISGQKVYNDVNATEADINKAIADIKAALKKLDGFNEADKKALKALLDKYNEVRKSDKYWNSTSKERDAYETAIIDGTNIYNNKKATQDEVDKAVIAIEEAYAALSGVEKPTEKTAKLTVEDAYVNDRYVRGTGIPGATVYYKVVGEEQTFANDKDGLRQGMRIAKDGKFAIDLGQVRANDKIYVYQQEVNKLMSEAAVVKILPLDKSELVELIKKAEEIKKTDKFKYAPEDRQKELENALAKATELNNNENSSKEEIDNAAINLRTAIASIENYEIPMVELTFKPNNDKDAWTLNIIKGEKVAKPADPVKEGYTFKGWFTDEEMTKEFNFDKAVEENTTLYAKWEEIIYTVTFNPANGKDAWTEKVAYGKTVAKPANDPVKDGYTFIAWQFDGREYNFDTSVMKNIELIAAWRENVKPEPNVPTPQPYEPYEPEPRPYRPHRPAVETKPVEETKPVVTPIIPEVKKEEGIIVNYPQVNVVLNDVPAGPEGQAIRNLVSYGIINGMGNGKFEGKITITRAMLTKVFMAISEDKSINHALNFKDITSDKWYTDPVMWAASNGIINGYTDGTFRPEKKVSRQEFCVMLMKLLNKYGIELKDVITVNPDDFKNVPAWSKDAMLAIKKAGLIIVEAEGKYSPESELTREELAKALDMLINFVRNNK